jgi:hypothetical protein
VKTGWEPHWTGDGNTYFTLHAMNKEKLDLQLEVTFEHDGSATAEKAFWRSETARLIQIKVEGSAAATGGSTYQKRTLLLNLAGKWQKFDKLDAFKGNDIVKGVFKARYDATAAKFAQIVVVNEVTALP